MVVRASESQPSTHGVAALLNFGVAEVVYGDVVSREHTVDVPLDSALRSWKQGLTMLKRLGKRKSGLVGLALEVRLLTNMSWGLLQMTHLQGNVEEASDYAGQALALYDNPKRNPNKIYQEGIGRVLALTAQCYHKSGGAVTAEGLFQSAIDQPVTSPLEKLQVRDAYYGYSNLCKDWDRREGDAIKYEAEARAIEDSLPSSWHDKSGIHGAFWFWTPGSLQE